MHFWYKTKFVKMTLNVGLRWTDVTNLLFSRVIIITRNDSEPFSSISDVNFVFLSCLMIHTILFKLFSIILCSKELNCIINESLFLTKLFSALTSSLERFLSNILEICFNDEYALSRSLLLTHSLLKSPIYRSC